MRNLKSSGIRKWPRVTMNRGEHGGQWLRWLPLAHPLTESAQSAIKLLLVVGGVGSFLVGYGLHNGLLFPPTLTQPPLPHNTQASAASGLGARVASTHSTSQRAIQSTHMARTLALHTSATPSRQVVSHPASHPATKAAPGKSGKGKGHGKGAGKGKDKGGSSGHGNHGGHGGHGDHSNHGKGRGKGAGAAPDKSRHSTGQRYGNGHGNGHGKPANHQAQGKQKKTSKQST